MKTVTVGEGSTDLGAFTLMCGDVDGSNEVNSTDLSTVITNMDLMGDN